MYSKLINGEYGLKDTFWKFGVAGIIGLNFIVKLFGFFLAKKLAGISIVQYYTKYFRPINMDSTMLVLTLCYFVSLAFFIFYCIAVVRGIWKSSDSYERSIWLRHISRLLILIFIFASFSSFF